MLQQSTINGKPAAIWTPAGYSTAKKYPLLVFYPGWGECGSDYSLLLKQGLPILLADGSFNQEFIVAAIQPNKVAASANCIYKNNIVYDIETLEKDYSVDSNRIYGTALSIGAWMWHKMISTTPNLCKKIAAVFLLSAGLDDAVDTVWRYTPNWTNLKDNNVAYVQYMGLGDPRYAAQKKLVEGIKASGVNAVWLEAPGGHDKTFWLSGYDANNKFALLGNLSMYEYLLKFSKESSTIPTEKPPVVEPEPIPEEPTDPTPPIGTPSVVLTLTPTRDNRIYLKGTTTDLSNVSKIIIPDQAYQSVWLEGLNAATPIEVQIGETSIGGYSAYNFVITNCSNLKFTTPINIDGKGTGGNGFRIGKGNDLYFKSISIKNCKGLGIQIKVNRDDVNDESCFYPNEIKNIEIGELHVENVTGEGTYFGDTNSPALPDGKIPCLINGLKIGNITTLHTGADGVQFSDAINVEIIGKINISDYGVNDLATQRDGLLIGGNVMLKSPIDGITITNGTGAGIRNFGCGEVVLKNAVLKNVAKSAGEDAIYSLGKSSRYGFPYPKFCIENVIVSGSGGKVLNQPSVFDVGGAITNLHWEDIADETPIVSIVNNVLSNVGEIIVIPPVIDPIPDPIPEPTITKVIAYIYDDNSWTPKLKSSKKLVRKLVVLNNNTRKVIDA